MSVKERLEKDLERDRGKIAKLRARGKDCMEYEHRLARTQVALEMLTVFDLMALVTSRHSGDRQRDRRGEGGEV
jgi:hypothetical protein